MNSAQMGQVQGDAQIHWAVGSGSTTATIYAVRRNPLGSAVNLSLNIANRLLGATMEFLSGSNTGAMRQVLSVNQVGAITLDAALDHTPRPGDLLVVALPTFAPPNGVPTFEITLPYDEFSASTTFYPYASESLHRHAQQRTLIVQNNLNEALSAGVGFYPYDSVVNFQPSGVAGGFTWGSGLGTNSQLVVNSQLGSAGNAGALAAAVDSFQGGYAMGTTAPTSGALYVKIVEEF